MPTWRCPHCGTPQAETARCWVCRRSSTACGTCRHFRRSVAAQLGYCGLDRGRMPLLGDEIRGCWESAAPLATATATVPAPVVPSAASERARRLEFVEVGTVRTAEPSAAEPPVVSPPPAAGVEPGWSLWGDLES